ncbi:MAG TPA: NfeD family protein [Acidothermaceae bacterium]|jgi:membrane protein implicated in regulation of membrane protease activity
MSAWVVWAIVAAICAGAEAVTLTLILGFVAVAAVAALLVAVLGGPVAVQLIAFIVGSAALVGLARPIAKAHLRTPAQLRSGVDALVGQSALVLETVSAHDGRVKIGGEVWTARAYIEDQVLQVGASVDVVKIQGATAFVYGSE